MASVIVLNSDYTYINTVSWQKAICLVMKGKVKVLKYAEEVARNFERTVEIRIPRVIQLLRYIMGIYRRSVPFSKRNVLIRDRNTCVYCGGRGDTIDHVSPRSKGGKTEWDNCVTACLACNKRKDSRTLKEAGMFFQGGLKPRTPTISEFVQIKQELLGIDKVLQEIWE
jgi:5-methylcytosine-specific restriction endonuclease McrA